MAAVSPTSTTSTPGLIGHLGGREVVGRDHDDRLAAAFISAQGRDRDPLRSGSAHPLLASDHEVVDQAGPSEPRRDGHENGPSVQALHRSEALRVTRLQVVGLDPRSLELRGRGGSTGSIRVLPRLGGVTGGAQGAAQRSRTAALVRAPGMRFESSSPGHPFHERWAGPRSSPESRGRSPSADHDRLLGVLLTEEDDLRTDRVQQLGDHRRHPAEVAGPALIGSTLEHLR